jgi:photosystem II stability/assembly factor-like uncharacterized protein
MKDRFLLSALAIPLALILPSFVAAQTDSPRVQPHVPKSEMPCADSRVKALQVEKFKLLSAGKGWVLAGGRILTTRDNGAHWKDISPPNPGRDAIADVFFLDEKTGWVMFFNQSDLPENSSFSSIRTANGGASWMAGKLPAWKGRPPTGSGLLIFADRLHGWMSIDNSANAANTSSALYASVDGGQTWRETRGGTEGALQAMTAVTGREIWALGTGEFSNELDVSRDGGNSFAKVELPAPKEVGPPYEPTYGLPKFENGQDGYIAVEYGGPSGSPEITVFFTTHNDGRSWSSDGKLSNFGGETDGADVANGLWIIPFLSRGRQTPALIKVPPMEVGSLANRDKAEFTGCHASFVSKDEGWVNCEGNLSSTIDGGTTWTDILPCTR